jgi:predicted GNAT family acetyltransferase
VLVRLDRFDSADAFLRAAGPFLRAREANHCLILGIAANLRLRPADSLEPPPYLATVRDGRRVVLVAFQTPPWQLVLSEVDEPDAMALIVADRLGMPLDEVAGPAEHVGTFARLWSEAAGVTQHRSMRERIMRLSRVLPPPPAPGALRVAGRGDAEVLGSWLMAFAGEALNETSAPDVATRVARWLNPTDERTMLFWDDGGPVSMAGLSGPTPTGIRVGPVYTPPVVRRRGYASNLVAAASQRELEGGRRACFLYTDLANRTSNHIYESIGYEPVRDFDQYRLG